MIAHRSSNIHEAIESMMMAPRHVEPVLVEGKGVRAENRDRANEKIRSSLLHLDLG